MGLHRLILRFGLPGFGSPGKETTTETETATTDPTSVTQSQATKDLPSIIVSTTLPPGVNPPLAEDAPVIENPPQA